MGWWIVAALAATGAVMWLSLLGLGTAIMALWLADRRRKDRLAAAAAHGD